MNWQNWVVAAVVLWAVGHLVWRAVAAARSRAAGGCGNGGACGGCGTCDDGGVKPTPGPRIDVPLESLTAKKPSAIP